MKNNPQTRTDPKPRNDVLTGVAIFLAAFALRLFYLFLMKKYYFFNGHPGDDVLYYQDWAREIARGDWAGDKVFYGLPLFPYYLAVLYRLTLGHWEAVQIIHLLLGSLNCVLLYSLAKRIFSTRVAVTAALLMAGNFLMIYYDWLMMPVALLIAISLVILLALTQENSLKKSEWFILGLLVGLGALGDGKFMIFAALIAAVLCRRWLKVKHTSVFVTMLVFILGTGAVLFGVTLRNRIVGGEWVFVSAQSGLSLFAGNNPDATGVYENPEFIRPTHAGQDEDQKIFVENLLQKKVTAAEVSRFWKHKAVEFIKENPGAYLSLLVAKLKLFFSESEEADDIDLLLQREWKQRFDVNPYHVMCPLALWGMALAWRDRRAALYSTLIVVSQLVTTLIFFMTTRHRATVVPVMILFEAYVLAWAASRISFRQWKQLVIPAAAIVLFLFLFKPQFADPESIRFLALTKSGPIYEQRKEFETAEAAYYETLALRPHDTNTIYNLATFYLNRKNYPKAEQFFQQALKLCHYNVDALFNLGYVYEETDKLDKALDSYTQVLKYQPDSLDARFRIAGLYQKKGDCAAAKAHYDVIIQQKPALKGEVKKFFSKCQ